MATWIAHLRVAEKLLKSGIDVDWVPFTVGNIGPDSGVPNEDWSSFDPPKKITHFQGEDKKIDAEAFYRKYINNEHARKQRDKFSFYIGYYVHLLTDIEWSKLYERKKKEPLYKEGLDRDPNFIWTIKDDWYGLDFLYLSMHPENIFFSSFKNIDKVPDYLDYFPESAFTKQVKYITDFYLGENECTKDNFIYLSEEEMDKFIDDTAYKIEQELKGVI